MAVQLSTGRPASAEATGATSGPRNGCGPRGPPVGDLIAGRGPNAAAADGAAPGAPSAAPPLVAVTLKGAFNLGGHATGPNPGMGASRPRLATCWRGDALVGARAAYAAAEPFESVRLCRSSVFVMAAQRSRDAVGGPRLLRAASDGSVASLPPAAGAEPSEPPPTSPSPPGVSDSEDSAAEARQLKIKAVVDGHEKVGWIKGVGQSERLHTKWLKQFLDVRDHSEFERIIQADPEPAGEEGSQWSDPASVPLLAWQVRERIRDDEYCVLLKANIRVQLGISVEVEAPVLRMGRVRRPCERRARSGELARRRSRVHHG
ncbi:unnamed protein product [Prorocentrum cordatum]|uniref:Uncharacterized protein n=1 Tax=Prorocentrum cordatum TaxID=2364126 RepID=A0ABN9QJ45_9DINO|nr:unnamed protein product [Polarella glacialis]